MSHTEELLSGWYWCGYCVQGMVLDATPLEYEPMGSLPPAASLTGTPPLWLALDEGMRVRRSSLARSLSHSTARSAVCHEMRDNFLWL